jgi:hypothetical protein
MTRPWARTSRVGSSAVLSDCLLLDATRLHSAPLGSSRHHSAPLGTTRLHSAPLGSTRVFSAPLGSTRHNSAPLHFVPQQVSTTHLYPLYTHCNCVLTIISSKHHAYIFIPTESRHQTADISYLPGKAIITTYWPL